MKKWIIAVSINHKNEDWISFLGWKWKSIVKHGLLFNSVNFGLLTLVRWGLFYSRWCRWWVGELNLNIISVLPFLYWFAVVFDVFILERSNHTYFKFYLHRIMFWATSLNQESYLKYSKSFKQSTNKATKRQTKLLFFSFFWTKSSSSCRQIILIELEVNSRYRSNHEKGYLARYTIFLPQNLSDSFASSYRNVWVK